MLNLVGWGGRRRPIPTVATATGAEKPMPLYGRGKKRAGVRAGLGGKIVWAQKGVSVRMIVEPGRKRKRWESRLHCRNNPSVAGIRTEN